MKRTIRSLLFPIIGFLSLIWFLVRVIPKPSRAGYPCQRAAFPIASSFVLYLTGLFTSALFFRKARHYLYEARYALFIAAVASGTILGILSLAQNAGKAGAVPYLASLEAPNQPMGQGKGIYPGRVVWVHDPDATSASYTNTSKNYWYEEGNATQSVVNAMLSRGIQNLTGTSSDAAAWDALFRNFNETHGRGSVGYTAGEKIAVKINLNGVWGQSPKAKNINTSPQVMFALLKQLINVAGAAQADITIGEPNINLDTPQWDKCHDVFPDVKYMGQSGSGRTPVTRSKAKEFFSSDGEWESYLPQCYMDAAYMINLPVFKKHQRAGISIVAKNHVGTFTPFGVPNTPWHNSLPCPEGFADNSNGDFGAYRCFVDFMGHENIGGKTILYLVDGLWGSINWGHQPIKWEMAPFNNDWPSSLFLSQDPVAVESVCLDFLFYEFDEDHPTEGAYDPGDNHGPFPHYLGVDDHLHQAADSNNWPSGLTYDPEKDGSPLPSSMGVHEHWNNAVEKQYSRNLGASEGIELVLLEGSSAVENDRQTPGNFVLYPNYPNPFNPSTTIRYNLPEPSLVQLDVYSVTGQRVAALADGQENAGLNEHIWDGTFDNSLPAPSGVYLYRLTVRNGDGSYQQVRRMVLGK